MAYHLIRWALPHKGKPKHLTSLEYYLRWMVFLPLWFITFAPIAIAIVCAAFIGPLGLTFYVGFTRGFSHDETAILVFSGIVLVISLALNQIIQHRFLTQR